MSSTNSTSHNYRNPADHVAILATKWHIMEKILDGRKTIESRWYVNKVAPWNKIYSGDTVYFKEAGRPVIAKSLVEKVLQFENLDDAKTKQIIKNYGKDLCMSDPNSPFLKNRNYCILVFLKDVKEITPFNIDKTGYGISSAWMVVGDIKKVKK